MWVEQGNLHSRVIRCDDAERKWLRDYLAFDATTWKGGRPRTEKTSLFSLVEEHFPSGFVPLVRKAAQEHGFKFELGDARTPPCKVVDDLDTVLGWLRPYQCEAVQAVIDKTRGVIKVPTGGGKTEIACGLAKSLPCKWLFLVPRTSLLDQAAERYEKRTGLVAGRIGDGQWEKPGPGSNFTVATFQTLARGRQKKDPRVLQLLQEVEGVIIDEAHVLPADSFWQVVMAMPNTYYRVGLSGTPLARTDKRSVLTVAATGRIIYSIKPEVLIDAGVLSRPKIRLITVEQASDLPTWQGVYGECIVRSSVRNRAIVQAIEQSAKPCLVFVKEIKHGQRLEKALLRAGLKADFVWGSDSTDRRKDAVKRLVRNDTDVLICSVIFQEGVDIPELRSVIIGSGGRSIIAALQRIGRGMRVTEGKTEFEVWDFDDRGNKWLERHTRIRMQAYTSEGYETVTVQSNATLPLLRGA